MVKILGPNDRPVHDEALDLFAYSVNDAVNNDDLEQRVWGLDGSRGYWFTKPITLNSNEKAALRAMMEDAGWIVVDVRNSADNGERPGLCTLILREHE